MAGFSGTPAAKFANFPHFSLRSSQRLSDRALINNDFR
jgi:hypothetical protein